MLHLTAPHRFGKRALSYYKFVSVLNFQDTRAKLKFEVCFYEDNIKETFFELISLSSQILPCQSYHSDQGTRLERNGRHRRENMFCQAQLLCRKGKEGIGRNSVLKSTLGIRLGVEGPFKSAQHHVLNQFTTCSSSMTQTPTQTRLSIESFECTKKKKMSKRIEEEEYIIETPPQPLSKKYARFITIKFHS